jgi:hypothetical protein
MTMTMKCLSNGNARSDSYPTVRVVVSSSSAFAGPKSCGPSRRRSSSASSTCELKKCAGFERAVGQAYHIIDLTFLCALSLVAACCCCCCCCCRNVCLPTSPVRWWSRSSEASGRPSRGSTAVRTCGPQRSAVENAEGMTFATGELTVLGLFCPALLQYSQAGSTRA